MMVVIKKTKNVGRNVKSLNRENPFQAINTPIFTITNVVINTRLYVLIDSLYLFNTRFRINNNHMYGAEIAPAKRIKKTNSITISGT